MNFLTGTLQKVDGGAIIDLGSSRMPIPKESLASVNDYMGKQVYFGVRPEDIHDLHFVPRGVDDQARTNANVTVVEPLGSEVYAFLDLGGTEVVGRLDPRTGAQVGQPLEIAFNMSKMHVFDKESERALI